jgi:hypothetical protein
MIEAGRGFPFRQKTAWQSFQEVDKCMYDPFTLWLESGGVPRRCSRVDSRARKCRPWRFQG